MIELDLDRFLEPWRRRAACRGMDPRWWHPLEGNAVNGEAVRICWEECPVRKECLVDAEKWKEQRGIWGGLTARERTRRRRDASRAGRSRPGEPA